MAPPQTLTGEQIMLPRSSRKWRGRKERRRENKEEK